LAVQTRWEQQARLRREMNFSGVRSQRLVLRGKFLLPCLRRFGSMAIAGQPCPLENRTATDAGSGGRCE
jgi:hypothetical protein